MLVLWFLTGATPVVAQTTDVVVDVDPTVTLVCLDPFEVTISTADLSAGVAGGVANDSAFRLSPSSVSVAATPGDVVATMPAMSGAALGGDPSSYDLTEVGCRISATPSFGNVNVRMSLTGNTTLAGPNGSEIRVNSVQGRLAGFGNGFASSFSYFALIHLPFIYGDTFIEFRINVDLSRGHSAGLHSSANDGTMIVEVTSP